MYWTLNNNNSKDAVWMVNENQRPISHSSLFYCRVVFSVRYAEPELLALSDSGNVNIERRYAACSTSSRIGQLEREVKALQRNLASKL